MYTPELVAYIRQQRVSGIPPETIRLALISSGWSTEDIRNSFAVALPSAQAMVQPIGLQQSRTGTKILLSAGLFIVSATYVLWQYFGGQPASTASPAITQASTLQAAPTSAPAGTPVPSSSPPLTTSEIAKKTTSTPRASTPAAPAPKPAKPAGLYVDGTYTGSVANAYYGMVQVEAVVQNGRLFDVKFLRYPSSHSTSVFINQQAMPYLTQEALQAQSANVNIISGATFTSQAFQQSLALALAKAKH